MGGEWVKTTVGEIVFINTDTYSPKEKWDYVNYLDTGNITSGVINSVQNIARDEKLPSRARRKVLAGDIVYSTVRPNQRHYGIIANPLENMLVSTGFSVIRGDNQNCYTKFLYYYLAQESVVKMLQTIGEHSTSAYPSIKPSDIESLSILLPPLSEQKAIAYILGTLDDKIELNRQMNATLEAMAQALFKSWFVNFDPVIDNALAAGNPIPDALQKRAEVRRALGDRRKPLPADIEQHFPSRFVFSEEMGWIPEGWEIKQLPELAEFQNGFAFYTVGYSETGYKVVDLANISSSGKFIETQRDKFVSSDVYNLPKHEKHQLHKNDIVMVMTDMTQAMGILGKCGIIKESGKYILNQRIGRIRAHQGISINFLLTYLNSSSQVDFLKRRALGTVQKYVNTNHIKEMYFTVPDQRIMDYFGESTDVFYSKISLNDNQIKKLSGLRDALLPKLLSGQLRVPEAEKLVTEAT